MALEDFDESGDSLELDMDQLDITPAKAGIDPDDPLNADLFDFSEMAIFDKLQVAAEQATAEEASGTTDEPAEQPAAEELGVDPPPSSPRHASYDPKLDEDIFNFSEIFAGGDVVANAAGVTVEDTFVVPHAVPEAAPTPAGPGASQGAPSPVAADELQPAAPPISTDEEDELIALAGTGLAPIAIPVVSEGPKDKLVMMLAAGFLVVNTALILLAWQANSSFHDTLRDVTRGITDGLSEVANRPAQAAQAGPVQFVPVPTTGHQPRSADQRSTELHSMPQKAILDARRWMGEGHYIDARRNLYHLLANRDLIALPTELVAEAEFLIAETYELQGSALIAEEIK